MQFSNTQLFHGIAEEELAPLFKCLRAFQKSYQKGDTILREGEPTACLGIVLSGMAVDRKSVV